MYRFYTDLYRFYTEMGVQFYTEMNLYRDPDV